MCVECTLPSSAKRSVLQAKLHTQPYTHNTHTHDPTHTTHRHIKKGGGEIKHINTDKMYDYDPSETMILNDIKTNERRGLTEYTC